MTVTDVVRAEVDREGRLTTADERLLTLNAAAGGRTGIPLAVPQIGALVRLALRLGILVSRSILVADGEEDLQLWLRVQPTPSGARMALSGWKRRPAWRATGTATQAAALDPEVFRWETDASLHLTALAIADAARLGVATADVLGQPLTGLFSLADAPAVAAYIAARRSFIEQPAALRDGRAVAVSATARTDAEGRFAGYMGHVRPEPASSSSTAPQVVPPDEGFGTRLERALRAPLGRIIANADSINAQTDGPIAGPYAGYAADIASAGRHLLGLVDDLANLAALDRPDFSVAREPIDLADVARRAAGLLQLRAADKAVFLSRPSDADATPASGEFRRVLQILVNVLGNAIRYSPEGGSVVIEVRRDGAEALVHVRDSGKGVAPADQERIFERFERLDPGEPGGSGLGLYISRRLARAMGGDLTVRSVPGKGACFTLRLPAAEAEPAA